MRMDRWAHIRVPICPTVITSELMVNTDHRLVCVAYKYEGERFGYVRVMHINQGPLGETVFIADSEFHGRTPRPLGGID